jgi:colanic acid biosynthesis glycosyl transferase WcaI
MRIAILNQFYVPDLSPTAHLAASLAEHRAANGDEVTIVTSRGGYVDVSHAAASAVDQNPRVYRLWTPRLGKASVLRRCIDYGVFYALACWRMLRIPAQDVIVSLTTPPYIVWAGVLHKLLHPRAKLVLWNMDCYPEIAERLGKLRENGLASRLLRAMNRALFRRLDHLVCLDQAMLELLCSQYVRTTSGLQSSVIPNWEAAAFFPPRAATAPWDRAEALQLRERLVVLYHGNRGYGHRFDTIVDVADRLRDEPIVFLFVGGGKRWGALAEAKRERGLENILLEGYVSKEMTRLVMAAAQCSLITLRDAVLGVISPSKLHASLAMRLPVLYVGPRKSNVDEAIERFGCGISVRHGEVDRVVDFLRELRSDPRQLAKLRARARRAFDEAYCDLRTLPQFDTVLQGLVHERRARRSVEPLSAALARRP